MTGDELALEACISRNTLYQIENRQENVRLDTVGAVARALKVDPCAFFLRDEIAFPTPGRIDNLRRTVATNIREIREVREISQNRMTDDLGLAKGYLGVIERNAPNLTLDLLDWIASYLKVQMEDLLVPRD